MDIPDSMNQNQILLQISWLDAQNNKTEVNTWFKKEMTVSTYKDNIKN